MQYKITPFENYTIITLRDPEVLPSLLLKKTIHKVHNTPIYDLGSRFHLAIPARFKTVRDGKLIETDVSTVIKDQANAILYDYVTNPTHDYGTNLTQREIQSLNPERSDI